MATIQKKGPWRYCATIRRKGFPVQSKTFASREEAVAWSMQIEALMLNGNWKAPLPDRCSVGDALKRYAAEITPGKKGARQELSLIRGLGKESFASLSLSALSGAILATWRDEQLLTYKPGTVVKRLAALSHLYTIGVKEWGMTELSNPVAHIRKPPVKNGRERRISRDEQKVLSGQLDAVAARVFEFALETAMRRSEIVGLKWGDIHGRVANLSDTKNGDSRAVPLSTTAMRCLGDRAGDSESCFDINGARIAYVMHVACAKAGIEGLVFHDCRHEATSRLFERGLSMMEVASITGHRTMSMLQRYTHLSAHDLVDRLG